jgi:hypothetical protein
MQAVVRVLLIVFWGLLLSGATPAMGMYAPAEGCEEAIVSALPASQHLHAERLRVRHGGSADSTPFATRGLGTKPLLTVPLRKLYCVWRE